MLHAGAAVANTAVPSIRFVAGSAAATAVSAITLRLGARLAFRIAPKPYLNNDSLFCAKTNG